MEYPSPYAPPALDEMDTGRACTKVRDILYIRRGRKHRECRRKSEKSREQEVRKYELGHM